MGNGNGNGKWEVGVGVCADPKGYDCMLC